MESSFQFGRKIERKVEIGCPQKSASSPLIWKIGINDLLEKLTEVSVEVTAFADDVAIVIEESHKQQFKNLVKKAFQIIP